MKDLISFTDLKDETKKRILASEKERFIADYRLMGILEKYNTDHLEHDVRTLCEAKKYYGDLGIHGTIFEVTFIKV